MNIAVIYYIPALLPLPKLKTDDAGACFSSPEETVIAALIPNVKPPIDCPVDADVETGTLKPEKLGVADDTVDAPNKIEVLVKDVDDTVVEFVDVPNLKSDALEAVETIIPEVPFPEIPKPNPPADVAAETTPADIPVVLVTDVEGADEADTTLNPLMPTVSESSKKN